MNAEWNAELHAPDVEKVVASTAELVTRVRQRTSEELTSLSSNRSASYAAAISGNTPYATLPNGITIAMRKGSSGCWSC